MRLNKNRKLSNDVHEFLCGIKLKNGNQNN